MAFQLLLLVNNVCDLHQEPGIDLAQPEHLPDAHAEPESIAHRPDAFGARRAKFGGHRFTVAVLAFQSAHTHFESAQSLLE